MKYLIKYFCAEACGCSVSDTTLCTKDRQFCRLFNAVKRGISKKDLEALRVPKARTSKI